MGKLPYIYITTFYNLFLFMKNVFKFPILSNNNISNNHISNTLTVIIFEKC